MSASKELILCGDCALYRVVVTGMVSERGGGAEICWNLTADGPYNTADGSKKENRRSRKRSSGPKMARIIACHSYCTLSRAPCPFPSQAMLYELLSITSCMQCEKVGCNFAPHRPPGDVHHTIDDSADRRLFVFSNPSSISLRVDLPSCATNRHTTSRCVHPHLFYNCADAQG